MGTLITSIDIGLVELGISLAKVNMETCTIQKILRAENINLIEITNQTCRPLKCPYYCKSSINKKERKNFAHYIFHFLEKYEYVYFNSRIRTILIERQPYTVFTTLEQILHFKYPERVILQSPTSLGKFLGTLGLEREEKKKKSVEMAAPYVPDKLILKHDFCDSICYILFFLEEKKNENFYFVDKKNPFKKFVWHKKYL